MDRVSQLVERMWHDGCVPNSISCSAIVEGYCVTGDLGKASEGLPGMHV